MHLVLMTRGILRQVEEFKSLLQAQRFPWKRTNLKTGKEEMMIVQGALRPIQLWEYVFPEESLPNVLGALGIKEGTQRKEIKSAAWMLRKMLKLDPIPVANPNDTVTGYRPPGTLNGKPMDIIPVHNMMTEAVAVYPIGVKSDITQDFHFPMENGGTASYHQEGL